MSDLDSFLSPGQEIKIDSVFHNGEKLCQEMASCQSMNVYRLPAVENLTDK